MTFFGFDMLPFCLDKLPNPDPKPRWYADSDNRLMGNRIINPGFQIWQSPVYEWKVLIGQLTIMVEKGKEPNAFNRFMQELVFGFKWRKN